MEYPQRWLKDHKAVATDKGWSRASGELLKCQKGLDVEPEESKDPVDPKPEG